eukprot:bmy_08143T0
MDAQTILYWVQRIRTAPAMWRGLGLALALCLLPTGGTESQGQSSFCKQPPAWSIKDQDPMLNSYGSVTASRLEDLRVKLEKEGYLNISYVVVNHQGISSRLKYVHLKNKVSEHIPVYQQEENQTDVWTLLNGTKDDFLIYDRCGRLVYHLGLPYSFLTSSHVEDSIKTVYCESKCGNCSLKTLEDEGFCKNVSLATEEKTTEAPQPHHHPHHHHHHHYHLENGHLSEYPKPEAPDNPEHPPPSGLHRHHRHRADRAFWQWSTSLNLDSDVCLQLPARQVSSSTLQKPAPNEAEKRRQKCENDLQIKYLKSDILPNILLALMRTET